MQLYALFSGWDEGGYCRSRTIGGVDFYAEAKDRADHSGSHILYGTKIDYEFYTKYKKIMGRNFFINFGEESDLSSESGIARFGKALEKGIGVEEALVALKKDVTAKIREMKGAIKQVRADAWSGIEDEVLNILQEEKEKFIG